MRLINEVLRGALILALLSCGTALAAPAPDASAPGQPNATREELAKQVVKAMHPDGRLMLMLAIKLNPVAVGLDITALNNEPSRTKAYKDAEQDIMKAAVPSLEGILAQMYSQQLTEDQLNGVLAFYRSPTGQAFVAASDRVPMTLEIAGDSAWPFFAYVTLQDYCKRVACTATELRVVDAFKGRLQGRGQLSFSPSPEPAPLHRRLPAMPNGGAGDPPT